MKRLCLAVAMAAALAGPACADEGEAGRLVAALDRFCDLVNQGDGPGALAYFAPAPSIVEDLAPYRWQGADAGASWLAAMGANAERAGMTNIQMHFLPATRVQITGDRGYAVLPGELSYTFKSGAVGHAQGHVTFVVQKIADAWRIESLNWAWESATD